MANPVVLRAGILLFAAVGSFLLGLFLIRRVRSGIAEEKDSIGQLPMGVEGLPIHAYHAVIQQLKQQKHELAAQQLSDRRKAKASDTLSSSILSNLSCGVVFFNTAGLVRQANPAARKLLGFASPIGLHTSDLFRTATLRPQGEGSANITAGSVADALTPAFTGAAAVRGVLVNHFTREAESHVLELTASPVLAEDGALMGTALVVTDKTDLERIRHDQKMQQEVSWEMAQELRQSLTTIAGYAQQLARSRDAELARQLADSIAHEAAQLDRNLGSFLGGARAATTNS